MCIKLVLCCRSDQPVPGGGPGGVSSAGVGAGLLSADGGHRGELASEHQVPAARLLHLRPHLRLWGQGQRDSNTHTYAHTEHNVTTVRTEGDSLLPPAGLRSGHPVLRVLPQGAAVGAAERETRAAQRGRPAAHHQPQPAGEEEHLRPLPLALLHRLPEVPHLRLQILHLRTPRPAAGEVSAPLFFTITWFNVRRRKTLT